MTDAKTDKKTTSTEVKEKKNETRSEIKNESNNKKDDVLKAEKPIKEEKTAKEITVELKPGMTVRVYQKIKEVNIKGEEKERVQFFDGMIIAKKHGREKGGTITVRKVSNGVGVEKIFPLNLPTIEKIEVKKQARVRRAKLYYLKRGFKKKLKETKFT